MSFIAQSTAAKYLRRNAVQQVRESLKPEATSEVLFGVLQKLINSLTSYPKLISDHQNQLFDIFQLVAANQQSAQARLAVLNKAASLESNVPAFRADILPYRLLQIIANGKQEFSANQRFRLEKWQATTSPPPAETLPSGDNSASIVAQPGKYNSHEHEVPDAQAYWTGSDSNAQVLGSKGAATTPTASQRGENSNQPMESFNIKPGKCDTCGRFGLSVAATAQKKKAV
jgi:hypothetical protein